MLNYDPANFGIISFLPLRKKKLSIHSGQNYGLSDIGRQEQLSKNTLDHDKLLKNQTMQGLLLDLVAQETNNLPETLLLLKIKYFVFHFRERLQDHHDKTTSRLNQLTVADLVYWIYFWNTTVGH